MKNRIRYLKYINILIFISIFICFSINTYAANTNTSVSELYDEYKKRFENIEYKNDILDNGFRFVENQMFPIELQGHGEVSVIPAFEKKYNRLALFFVNIKGDIVYKTDQLETNNIKLGQIEQPTQTIAAISFQDVNHDKLIDVILITSCLNDSVSHSKTIFKIGDVLFQNSKKTGFYRDYRISDKINRFGMNKSVESITAFVRDGYSTEFLYTATTLEELQNKGFKIITEQCYSRRFEKLGRLQVVPGVYKIAYYDIFMIYLVNEQGYILSSLEPMGSYDNLYALKGINCRDIDGDGLKDIIVLARYSYEGDKGKIIVENDYSIYYQRTGGFFADNDIKNEYQCSENETMEALVKKARAYWGWKIEND